LPKGALDFFDVPVNLNLRKDFGDLALPIDDHRRPFVPHVFMPEHRFLLPDAERFRELVVGIR
jgi:hypothetical protein